ncbi:MAG: DUF2085 domain-containing protein [Candidatus Helarchaeota archaeon]|nr:DUF2085 domain-containing protein [Candidatus Helarchaeota archaeon]
MGTKIEKLKNMIHLFFSHHTEEYYNRTFTISVRGKEFHICARCSGVVICFLVSFSYFILKKIELESTFSLILATLLVIPVLIDWGTQKLGYRESINSIRFITGSLLGFGIALLRFTYEHYLITIIVISIYLIVFFIIAIRSQ